MKLKLLLLFLLFFSICTFAQSNKGNFFVETGVKAFGGSDFLNFIGKTGFSYNKTKWATHNLDGSIWQEDSYNSFSWSIAPRLGYCIGNRFKSGIDFQYYKSKMSYGFYSQNWTSGLFFRFNFNDKKLNPFIEVSSGLGFSEDIHERTSPGGSDYQSIDKFKLFYYSGATGLTYVVSGNFNLNLSVKMQNTLGNEIENNTEGSISYIIEKTYNLEIVPMLSVTYIFNKKS